MVEHIIKLQKNTEETKLNPEAKVQSYIPAEFDNYAVAGDNNGVAVSVSTKKKTAAAKTESAEDSGYLANTSLLRNMSSLVSFLSTKQTPIYNYTLNKNYQQYFSTDEITKLQDYANNGQWSELRALLNKRLADYQSVLDEYDKLLKKNPALASGAIAAEIAKIKTAVSSLQSLSNDTDENISVTLFIRTIVGYEDSTEETSSTTSTTSSTSSVSSDAAKTTSVEEAFEAIFGELTEPSPDSDLSVIINYQILSGIYSLMNDEDFYSTYYADRVTDAYYDLFSYSEISQMELLANEGKWDELKDYLKDLIGTYTEIVDEYEKMIEKYPDLATGTLVAELAKIKNVILPQLNYLSGLSETDLEQTLFKKVETEFIIPNVEKLDAVKTQILFYANLEKLLIMLGQAKIDGYNMVKQVLDNQSGYEKMNLRKIGSKRMEILANYVNTRKTEIYDYVNNYNERVKAEIEEEILESQEDSEGNFFVRAGLGVISFVAGLIASIFSLGMVAPLVLSSISTSYEIFTVNQEAEDDIKLRKELEKLEEELALLQATQAKEERELAEKKVTELLEQRKISKVTFMSETGITETQWEQLVAMGYIDDNGYVQEKLYSDPEAFAADAAAVLGANLAAVQNYLSPYLNNNKYYSMLDIESLLYSSLCDLDLIDETSGGYYQFSNQNYLSSYMRTQVVASAFRLYQSIAKARSKGRNIVAEELGIGKTSEAEYGDEIFKNNLEDVFKKLNRLSELQFEKAQALNRKKELLEEIENLQLSSWYKMLGSALFQGVDLVTFGATSLFMRHMLSPLGRGLFDYFTQYDVNKHMSYNDVSAQTLDSSTLLSSIYSDIVDGTSFSSLTMSTTSDRLSVNYDTYLAKLQQLTAAGVLNSMYISIYAADINSRSMVHQALSDVKGYSASTAGAEETFQEQSDVSKEVLQKQVQLANSAVQSNNRRVMADLELTKSGYKLATSVLSGLVAGYSKGTDDLTQKLLGNTLRYILENNTDDILDLTLNNSDFYLNSNETYYGASTSLGNSEIDAELKRLLNSNLFVSDSRGQTVLNSTAVAQKIYAVYQVANVNQVISSLAEARQKARSMIMSVISEKPSSGDTNSLARKQAEINTAAIQDKLDAISQKLTNIADLLTQRNLRVTQAQRNILTSALQVGLGSMLLGGYPDKEYYSSVTSFAKVLLTTSFTVNDLADDIAKRTLAIRQGLVAENTTVNESLLLGKIEASEAELMAQAMSLKQNIGRYGLGGVNTSALQQIKIQQRKLQVFKQKILSICEELEESASVVHATLESQVIELNGLAKQIVNSNKQFFQSMLSELKKQNSQISKQYSQRAKELLQSISTVTENSVNASMNMTGLMNGASSKATLNTMNYYIGQLNSSIQALVKVSMEKIGSRSKELYSLDGLQAGEVQELLAASASEESQLLEQSNLIMRDVNKLLNEGANNTGSLINSSANKREFYVLIRETLLDQSLRQLRLEQARLQAMRSDLLNQTNPDRERLNLIEQQIDQNALELQRAERNYQRDCARIETIVEEIYFQYDELVKQNEKVNPLLRKYSDPQRQNALNSQLKVILGSADNSLLTDNLSTYLQMTETEARSVEARLSREEASDLRAIYDFVKIYRQILKDSILMAKVQVNRQSFHQYLSEYNRQYYALNGETSPEYRAFMLADYFYSSYIGREKSMNKMLGQFNEINDMLRNRINNSGSGVSDEDNPYSSILHLALNRSLYSGIENYQPIDSEEDSQEIQEYFDQQWKLMGNIIRQQNSFNYRSRGLTDRWTIYFWQLNRERRTDTDQSLNERYVRAERDLQVIEELFTSRGVEERIDIRTADISQGAKDYIMQIVGNNVVYNPQCRQLIRNYLRRKMENIEIQLLQRDTDNQFAYNVLNREMEEITSLQSEYNDVWLEYEEAFRTNNATNLNRTLERLNRLKAQIEEAELKFRRKREAYANRLQRQLFAF